MAFLFSCFASQFLALKSCLEIVEIPGKDVFQKRQRLIILFLRKRKLIKSAQAGKKSGVWLVRFFR